MMITLRPSSLSLLLALLPMVAIFAQSHSETVLGVHGSGTTNPSKCYWNILDRFEEQAGLPVRMTYRAVGSSTGIEEFVNGADASGNPPSIDFASGDIPVPTEAYQQLQAAGIGVVHIPVLMGAVGVFHSVPDVPDLNLTACLLAKIYTRQITQWTDSEIMDRNPNLVVPAEARDITVGVRLRGSSSTESFTKYLHNACPEVFPQDLVAELPAWPEDHQRCQGSGGMTECIQTKPGTVGYIDSGHGHSAGLEEIDLENLQGTFLNSKVAKERDGIAAAVRRSNFPDATTDNFGDVNLVNAPGANTWPIVQMTYIYVRQNLWRMPNPNEQSLLVAWLRSLLDDDYIGECAEKYGFTLPSPEVRAFAGGGIDLLEQGLLPNATKWFFENVTSPLTGAGPFVISPKRRSIADVERAGFTGDIEDLQLTVSHLESALATANAELETLGGGTGLASEVESFMTTYVASKDTQLTAALVLAALSFCFWAVYLLVAAFRYCGGGGGGAGGAGGDNGKSSGASNGVHHDEEDANIIQA